MKECLDGIYSIRSVVGKDIGWVNQYRSPGPDRWLKCDYPFTCLIKL